MVHSDKRVKDPWELHSSAALILPFALIVFPLCLNAATARYPFTTH